ncbi:hypothetical protein K7X08_008599 [Anisodus acutangulus]|uniref:RNase H type-1 domain-containing protein n=1 Tax=Anisodus acutangulus TaxID=402998 RepID=A0A9Q1MU01_9SOLA|nr:hypothetical protein K7X08_008599 [Anisodus acutangulus]
MVIETDSTIARLIMIQEVSAPWAVDTIVRKIITLLRDKEIRFSHVYREANYAIDEEISGTFEEFHQLPAQARKLINVDKAQIPSFRVSPSMEILVLILKCVYLQIEEDEQVGQGISRWASASDSSVLSYS